MSAAPGSVTWLRTLLVFPTELKPDVAAAALSSVALMNRRGIVMIETTAEPGRISHHLITDDPNTDLAQSSLTSAVPGLRVEDRPLDHPDLSRGIELKLSSHDRALRTDAPESISLSLLSAMQGLKSGEQIRLQWIVRPARGVRPAQKPGRTPPPPPPGSLTRLLGSPNNPADGQKEALAKRARPLMQAIGRIAVTAATRPRQRQLIGRCLSAVGSANRPGVGVRYRLLPAGEVARRVNRRQVPWLIWPMLVNIDELVGLLGWPIGNVPLPGLERGHARVLPVSGRIPSTGAVLADSNQAGRPRPIAISSKDRLQHLHVIGPTGSGKSYLLANLALQDITAGSSVIVIDPKGDLVDDILDRVHQRDASRIVVLDPTEADRPVGLNLLQASGETRELLVESIVSVFHELYRSFWGPRSDDILRAALTTLVSAPTPYTICEVPSLLADTRFRRHVLQNQANRDPVLASFWQWYEAMSDGERTQAIGPVLNKLRAFTMRPRLRNVVGQTNGLRMAEVMAKRQVLLVKLNSGLLGRDAAQLFGSLLVAQLWQASLQRVVVPQAQRHPVMVTIDEVQDFLRLPVDVGDMLAQARGLGVGLTLAHQHLGQLPSGLKAGVMANARSRVMFRVGPDDARDLSTDLAPHLDRQDLEGLRAYEVALRLSVNGSIQPPTTGVTRDLPTAAAGQAAQLIQQSSKRFGTAVDEIQQAMAERQLTTKTASAGRELGDQRAATGRQRLDTNSNERRNP